MRKTIDKFSCTFAEEVACTLSDHGWSRTDELDAIAFEHLTNMNFHDEAAIVRALLNDKDGRLAEQIIRAFPAIRPDSPTLERP
jgi:hypothetical protein